MSIGLPDASLELELGSSTGSGTTCSNPTLEWLEKELLVDPSFSHPLTLDAFQENSEPLTSGDGERITGDFQLEADCPTIDSLLADAAIPGDSPIQRSYDGNAAVAFISGCATGTEFEAGTCFLLDSLPVDAFLADDFTAYQQQHQTLASGLTRLLQDSPPQPPTVACISNQAASESPTAAEKSQISFHHAIACEKTAGIDDRCYARACGENRLVRRAPIGNLLAPPPSSTSDPHGSYATIAVQETAAAVTPAQLAAQLNNAGDLPSQHHTQISSHRHAIKALASEEPSATHFPQGVEPGTARNGPHQQAGAQGPICPEESGQRHDNSGAVVGSAGCRGGREELAARLAAVVSSIVAQQGKNRNHGSGSGDRDGDAINCSGLASSSAWGSGSGSGSENVLGSMPRSVSGDAVGMDSTGRHSMEWRPDVDANLGPRCGQHTTAANTFPTAHEGRFLMPSCTETPTAELMSARSVQRYGSDKRARTATKSEPGELWAPFNGGRDVACQLVAGNASRNGLACGSEGDTGHDCRANRGDMSGLTLRRRGVWVELQTVEGEGEEEGEEGGAWARSDVQVGSAGAVASQRHEGCMDISSGNHSCCIATRDEARPEMRFSEEGGAGVAGGAGAGVVAYEAVVCADAYQPGAESADACGAGDSRLVQRLRRACLSDPQARPRVDVDRAVAMRGLLFSLATAHSSGDKARTRYISRKLRPLADPSGDVAQRIGALLLGALDARFKGDAVELWHKPLDFSGEQMVSSVTESSFSPMTIRFPSTAFLHEAPLAMVPDSTATRPVYHSHCSHSSCCQPPLTRPPATRSSTLHHSYGPSIAHAQVSSSYKAHPAVVHDTAATRPVNYSHCSHCPPPIGVAGPAGFATTATAGDSTASLVVTASGRRVHILVFGHVLSPTWVSLLSSVADRLTRQSPVTAATCCSPSNCHRDEAPRKLHVRVTTVSFHTSRFSDAPISVWRSVSSSVLHAAAAAYGITMEVETVEASPNVFNPNDCIRVLPGEELVVLAFTSLMLVHDGSVLRSNPRDRLLKWIKDQCPKLFLLAEVDADFNGPFFLSRFKEVFKVLSAVFGCVDATIPASVPVRMLFEGLVSSELLNVVACEGSLRAVRAEKLEQWNERLGRMGFDPVPFHEETEVALCELIRSTDKRFGVAFGLGVARLFWDGTPVGFVQSWR